ncbi:coagulation factor V-like [Dendronephthya gigantea]|uniref:coagulation factor V-like n=1 Tax=Dendronephthya gigantea TaxID=151771 RepID=UPI00106D4C24|nr:coagulation factor V-like [Dendronephthya gigantea]XP_028401253.1 coagulation factor V-like [Dendronephthya gigantea]
MLNWTTYYPVSLNVGIEGFQITWFSGRDGGASNCDYKKVVLDSMQSNYTIQGLQSSGCRNYTIMLEVIFKSDTYPGCTESKPEILFFISPPDPDVTSITPPIHIAKSSSSGAMATAGFAVAAILGGIVIVGLMFLWMRRKKPKPSMEALGVENGQIQDYQITSSSFCEGLPPQEGRLHGDACWSASGNDKNQWIQIDLSRDKDITAIATQGRKDADEWVKSYIVSYSTDGKEFQCYQDDGVWKLFEGNTDKNTVQKNDLSSPITARFIRIHPQSWFDHISMRIELYGLNGSSQKGVKVLILNPHHCNLCTGVVHALGTLLIKTGHIRCAVDIFTPVRDMCNGLTSWTQDMILNSDYVIIPWLCKVNPPRQDNTVNDIKSLIFGASLKIVEAELVTQNRRNKFIPVCLDDYLLEDLPPNLMLLPTYNIPSEIDDLVINLLGKTKQRPDTKWPIVEFEDKDYRVARSNLQEAVNKRKKDHPHL